MIPSVALWFSTAVSIYLHNFSAWVELALCSACFSQNGFFSHCGNSNNFGSCMPALNIYKICLKRKNIEKLLRNLLQLILILAVLPKFEWVVDADDGTYSDPECSKSVYIDEDLSRESLCCKEFSFSITLFAHLISLLADDSKFKLLVLTFYAHL